MRRSLLGQTLVQVLAEGIDKLGQVLVPPVMTNNALQVFQPMLSTYYVWSNLVLGANIH